jgi:hypothetical protein
LKNSILITEVITEGNIDKIVLKILITEVITEGNIDKIVLKLLFTESNITLMELVVVAINSTSHHNLLRQLMIFYNFCEVTS